jgi:hypothetical protein
MHTQRVRETELAGACWSLLERAKTCVFAPAAALIAGIVTADSTLREEAARERPKQAVPAMNMTNGVERAAAPQPRCSNLHRPLSISAVVV